MNRDRHDLLPIGSFARATQLSPKALRLYAQLGILKPAYVDPESGYRYYDARQLYAARLIRLLREMDLPLALIRQVLASGPDEAETLIREHLNSLQSRLEQARRTVHVVINYLHQEEVTMPLEVRVRQLPAQPVLSITQRTRVDKLDQLIREAVDRLNQIVSAQGGKVSGAPFGVYRGQINEQDDGPIEVCVPVERMLTSVDGIVARELPAAQVASVIMEGEQCDFPAILKGYDAIYDWIHQNGYEMADSPREVWLSPPGQSARMEIAWPFREVSKTV